MKSVISVSVTFHGTSLFRNEAVNSIVIPVISNRLSFRTSFMSIFVNRGFGTFLRNYFVPFSYGVRTEIRYYQKDILLHLNLN